VVADLSWQSVEPVPEMNGDVTALLATIEDLRRIWEASLLRATPAEVEEARKRSLRRHAIETGIIERLYDLDWGVTEALVAEGLTLEVAEREGGLSDDTLAIIRDQYSALDYLAEACRGGVDLSLHLIRELHDLLTRHQETYEATNQFGRIVRAPLLHGDWKKLPNWATREDGSRIHFAPPEQVQSEMDRLVEEHHQAAHVHPIVRAAWLHHRFILIHPFADGNGRVARALTTLEMLQTRYAPLVVDRRQRAEYIATLDRANAGDLRPLVRFVARLEGIALRSELIRPVEPVPAGTGALDVVRAHAERLRATIRGRDEGIAADTQALAAGLHGRLGDFLRTSRDQFRAAFRSVDPLADATVMQAAPGDDRATWWRAQIVRTANAVDFYTNLRDGTWWTLLRLTVFGQTLRYVAVIQKVGRGEVGVLAATVFAELVEPHGDDESVRPTPVLTATPDDSLTLLYTESVDGRWPDMHDFVDRTLAAAIDTFSRSLG
jgi:Fic family protein